MRRPLVIATVVAALALLVPGFFASRPDSGFAPTVEAAGIPTVVPGWVDPGEPVAPDTTPPAPEPLAATQTPEPPPATSPPPPVIPRMVSAPAGLEPCGGDLPPCYVKARESGGRYDAVNWGGCGGRNCYGAWQFSGEWAGKLGLPDDLLSATPEQQDNAARILWAGGRGCGNWAACQ